MRSADERRKSLGIAAGLNELNIATGVHAEAAQRLDGKIVRVAADPAHADLLAFEIFRFFDIAAGHQGLSHGVFDSADEHDVCGTADISSDISDPAGHRHLRVAAQQSRGHDSRRRNKNQTEIEIVLLEQARFLRHPGHRLRHHPRGMNPHQFVRSLG